MQLQGKIKKENKGYRYFFLGIYLTIIVANDKVSIDMDILLQCATTHSFLKIFVMSV